MGLNAIVLGSAAGGGFPQWNCRCPVCRRAWDGDLRVKRRTQTSIAVSADGRRWSILNASPDLRAQIGNTRVLQPHAETRSSPIEAVVLTGGEIDQTAGLLSLRERQPFALYGTAETLHFVDANPMFGVLAPDVVERRSVALGDVFRLPGGVEARLFAVPGKLPLYLEGDAPRTNVESAANVGVELSAGSARLGFVPGCASVTPALKDRLAGCDALFFDATLFVDDEMIRTGTGTKTGRRMGHMPIDGADGSLVALDGIAARRIYIHINNTNPILIADSPERQRVTAAGWEIAEDGMEVVVG
jgi:pyrroloquinoline quinone biosynthesis protein B